MCSLIIRQLDLILQFLQNHIVLSLLLDQLDVFVVKGALFISDLLQDFLTVLHVGLHNFVDFLQVANKLLFIVFALGVVIYFFEGTHILYVVVYEELLGFEVAADFVEI